MIRAIQSLHVLVIDDDRTDALIAAEALTADGGFRVTHAECFKAAREILASDQNFDAILLDLGLPDQTGLGGCEALHREFPQIAVAVLTGRNDDEVGLAAVKAGAQDYLVKGKASGRELCRAIRYAVERSRMQRDLERSEASLRASEERFRLIANATTDVIWDWDLQHGSIWWSEGLRKTLGYEPHEVTTPKEWDGRIHEQDRGQVMDGLSRLFGGERTSWTVEYRVRRRDGSYAYVCDTGHVFRDSTGRATRMIGGMTDLTEKRNLQAQLFQSQKLEAIGSLAGGIAHDFNNLLTVINGNVELLLMTLPEEDTARPMLSDVRNAGERAGMLTRQLLAFSRKQMMIPQVLDLNAVLRNVINILSRLIGEHIDIRIHLEHKLSSIRVDPSQLEQVIINLSVNARDAMPDGGRLTIESASIVLEADPGNALPAGNYVALVISDTGCGIAPELLPRIFEPFFTTKPAGMGTGLGLSTVFGIVAQSKGSIRAESEVGVGTRFTILFPAVSQVAQQAVRDDDVAPMGSETVLVVEDAAGVRAILHRTLETLGYQVLLAEDARQAMEVFLREPVDVVLTDVVMPSVTGVDLVRSLRELKPSLKVLYMSGYTDLEVLRTGVYDSGDTLLQKPFSRQALASALRTLLDGNASDSPTAAV